LLLQMDLLPHIVDAEATGLLTLMERRLCIPHDEYKEDMSCVACFHLLHVR
jgi:hypothetical protein